MKVYELEITLVTDEGEEIEVADEQVDCTTIEVHLSAHSNSVN